MNHSEGEGVLSQSAVKTRGKYKSIIVNYFVVPLIGKTTRVTKSLSVNHSEGEGVLSQSAVKTRGKYKSIIVNLLYCTSNRKNHSSYQEFVCESQ